MTRRRFWTLWAVRGLAFALFLLTAGRSWAGFWIYRAERAYNRGDFQSAVSMLDQAARTDRGNPKLIYLLGVSAWQCGVTENDPGSIERAYHLLSRFVRRMPFYGRAWLYLGMIQIKRAAWSEGDFDAGKWARIQPFFEAAVEKEPTSAWVSYLAGKHLLEHETLLAPEAKARALQWIAAALSRHDTHRHSNYLDPAFDFLWQRFRDFSILKRVTPVDYVSYLRLTRFAESKGLWEDRHRLEAVFERLSRAHYERRLDQGEKFMAKGKHEKALRHFQEAVWIRGDWSEARVGLVAARASFYRLDENLKRELTQILENEDQVIWHPEWLEVPVARINDFYLKGLYAMRRGDHRRALIYFESLKPSGQYPALRRSLIRCYLKIGARERALTFLREALEEKQPDLRDLLAFDARGEDPGLREELAARSEQLTTRSMPSGAWWRKGSEGSRILSERARIGVSVHLKPGAVRLRLVLSNQSGESGYLRLRLWDGNLEKRLGHFYVRAHTRKLYTLEFESSGGIRWFEAELLNGGLRGKSGARVEFGPLEISYPHEA